MFINMIILFLIFLFFPLKHYNILCSFEATEGVVAKIYEKFVDNEGYAGFYFIYIYNIMRLSIYYWGDYFFETFTHFG